MSDEEESERQEARMRKIIDEYIETKELYLNKQGININHLEYLCSRKTEEITMILLGWNHLRKKEAAIFQKGRWDNLKNLSLWGNNIQSKGCKQLSKAKLPQLQFLNLNANRLQDRSVLHLSKMKLPNLQKIQLQQNKLSSSCIVQLVKARWNNLTKIQICSNSIGDHGIHYIIMTKNSLQLLRLGSNKNQKHAEQKNKALFEKKFGKIYVYF